MNNRTITSWIELGKTKGMVLVKNVIQVLFSFFPSLSPVYVFSVKGNSEGIGSKNEFSTYQQY